MKSELVVETPAEQRALISAEFGARESNRAYWKYTHQRKHYAKVGIQLDYAYDFLDALQDVWVEKLEGKQSRTYVSAGSEGCEVIEPELCGDDLELARLLARFALGEKQRSKADALACIILSCPDGLPGRSILKKMLGIGDKSARAIKERILYALAARYQNL